MKFYEVCIKKCSSGFGEYETVPTDAEGWDDKDDLIAEMVNNGWGVCELGVDELPAGVDDIRGRIHNEPEIILAIINDGESHYTGIQVV